MSDLRVIFAFLHCNCAITTSLNLAIVVVFVLVLLLVRLPAQTRKHNSTDELCDEVMSVYDRHCGK